MREGFEIVETADAEAHAHVPPPVLVILPDPESTLDVQRPVLGRSLVDRLAQAAQNAGFGGVLMGAGTRAEPEGAQELATGEPVERPALVVYEGSWVHPELLRLMVAHPLESGERYTLYDEVGRPTALFTGSLPQMPSGLPITEELPWPDHLGPVDVVRMVYEEDLVRAEALVLRGSGVGLPGRSAWHRRITIPILRRLSNSRRPLAQIELMALAIGVMALPMVLGGGSAGLLLGGFVLLAGVQVSRHIRTLRELRGSRSEDAPLAPGERVARATRPLTHATIMVAMTYVLVAQTHRSTVAAVVLLAAGGSAALLSLVQARLILRDRPAEVFAVPEPETLAARLGVTLPRWVEGAPLIELTVLVASVPGHAALPWLVLAVVAVARLWRWYVGPGLLDGQASAET